MKKFLLLIFIFPQIIMNCSVEPKSEAPSKNIGSRSKSLAGEKFSSDQYLCDPTASDNNELTGSADSSESGTVACGIDASSSAGDEEIAGDENSAGSDTATEDGEEGESDETIEEELITDDSEIGLVSYSIDIKPILDRSCTSCHSAAGGESPNLDSYVLAKNNINESIDETATGSMPTVGPNLSPDEIDLLQSWSDDGLLEN